jgi:putative redox protein
MSALVTTSRRPGTAYSCDIAVRQHHLVADEPEDAGGEDLGPTPVELVSAALGSCTAMTIEMYARRKGWNISKLEVSVVRETVNDPSATLEGRIERRDQFRTRIHLEGDLDDDQRARLFTIAARCPVHRMLAGSPILINEFA